MNRPVMSVENPLAPPHREDGRQSETARDIARGATRCLAGLGYAALPEVTLANGRRADLIAVSAQSEIWIIEIKSSIEDFRSDGKWPEYQGFCDRFFFAVMPEFPREHLPETSGLLLADRFGGEIVRQPEAAPLSGARRKALLTSIARTAAFRLAQQSDPQSGDSLRGSN